MTVMALSRSFDGENYQTVTTYVQALQAAQGAPIDLAMFSSDAGGSTGSTIYVTGRGSEGVQTLVGGWDEVALPTDQPLKLVVGAQAVFDHFGITTA
jgi:hypothetical protein